MASSVATPSIPGVTDSYWFTSVSQIFAAGGVPIYIWLPIMMGESKGNPGATGDNGMSFGLFQLYTGGGQGDGHTAAELENPITNAQLAAPAIIRAYQEFGNNLTQVAAYSGHPNALTAGYSEIASNIIPWLFNLFPSIAIHVAGGISTGSVTNPSTQGGGGGQPASTPPPNNSATQYTFSNGMIHLGIALLLVIVGLVAIYYGLYLLLGTQVESQAKAIEGVAAIAS